MAQQTTIKLAPALADYLLYVAICNMSNVCVAHI